MFSKSQPLSFRDEKESLYSFAVSALRRGWSELGPAIKAKLKRGQQAELAEKLNVSRATLCNWLAGRREPRLDQMSVIADFLGTTVPALLGIEVSVPAESTQASQREMELEETLAAVAALATGGRAGPAVAPAGAARRR